MEVGIQTDKTAEIKAGIQSGDTVIVAGQNGLRDGTKIIIKTSDDAAQQSASAGAAPAAPSAGGGSAQ